jgi:hypothetical protein
MHILDAFTTSRVSSCQTFILKKPIYDIPGFPEVLAGDLVDN